MGIATPPRRLARWELRAAKKRQVNHRPRKRKRGLVKLPERAVPAGQGRTQVATCGFCLRALSRSGAESFGGHPVPRVELGGGPAQVEIAPQREEEQEGGQHERHPGFVFLFGFDVAFGGGVARDLWSGERRSGVCCVTANAGDAVVALRTLERLDERKREEFRLEQGLAEQKVLDELVNARTASGRGRGTAGGPSGSVGQ